jgi:hypothetical protein
MDGVMHPSGCEMLWRGASRGAHHGVLTAGVIVVTTA